MAYMTLNGITFKTVSYLRLDILANAEMKGSLDNMCPNKTNDNYNILSLFLDTLDLFEVI